MLDSTNETKQGADERGRVAAHDVGAAKALEPADQWSEYDTDAGPDEGAVGQRVVRFVDPARCGAREGAHDQTADQTGDDAARRLARRRRRWDNRSRRGLAGAD